MKRKQVYCTLIGVLLLVSLPMSRAYGQSDWSAWKSLRHSVSVSFKIVKKNHNKDGHLWKWRFRNDGDKTITYVSYRYATREQGEHGGILSNFAKDLKPGEVYDSPYAAHFVSTAEPIITIISVKHK